MNLYWSICGCASRNELKMPPVWVGMRKRWRMFVDVEYKQSFNEIVNNSIVNATISVYIMFGWIHDLCHKHRESKSFL